MSGRPVLALAFLATNASERQPHDAPLRPVQAHSILAGAFPANRQKAGRSRCGRTAFRLNRRAR